MSDSLDNLFGSTISRQDYLMNIDLSWLDEIWDQAIASHRDLGSHDRQFPQSDLRQHSPTILDTREQPENGISEQLASPNQDSNSTELALDQTFVNPTIQLSYSGDNYLAEPNTIKSDLYKSFETLPVSTSYPQRDEWTGREAGNKHHAGQKRVRNENNQKDGHEPENASQKASTRPAKRSKNTYSTDEKSSGLLFACPYRKHNPSKYNLEDSRSCALTGHDNIARVKGHLYRCHRIIQCPRCKITFKTKKDLETHQKALVSCELEDGGIEEGFPASIEEKLRSRKKSHPGQTQDEQWKSIYQLLFPNESIPDPHFELIEEELRIEKFQTFSCSMLSELICDAIDMTCYENKLEMNSLLKEKLPAIIKECQKNVFLRYKGHI